MTEFGDYANINPDKLLKQAQQRVAKIGGMQERITGLVGEAESADGYVRVTYTANGGIADLELNPRAMRMASSDLAQTIKDVVQAAANDLQSKIRQEMSSAFQGEGDNPMDLANDPEKVKAKAEEVKGMLDGALNDALGQMDLLRKKMGI
ncbi:MAG: YbaB/EbfC family nucleoid-associated protein [Actinoallomurus sp.]